MIKVIYKRFGINHVEYLNQVESVSVSNELFKRPNVSKLRRLTNSN